MSRSLNKVMLIGHLGRDAETSYLASGTAVTKFSVATTHSVKKGDAFVDETNWTNIVLWKGEKVAPYLLKGSQVYVEGRLSTRSYEKDGVKVWVTDVTAEEVILLGSKQAQADQPVSQPRSRPAAKPTSYRGDPPPNEITDEDVPF